MSKDKKSSAISVLDETEDEQTSSEASDQSSIYRARDAITTNVETIFWGKLQRRQFFRLVNIQAKVRLADIIGVEEKYWKTHGWELANRHIDFLCVDKRTAATYFAIELDDSSHDTPKNQKRDRRLDELFQLAGIPLIRVRAASWYDFDAIEDEIRSKVPEVAKLEQSRRDFLAEKESDWAGSKTSYQTSPVRNNPNQTMRTTYTPPDVRDYFRDSEIPILNLLFRLLGYITPIAIVTILAYYYFSGNESSVDNLASDRQTGRIQNTESNAIEFDDLRQQLKSLRE